MPTQHIHIIGIGGCGSSGIARYLQGLGFEVTGSDNDRDRVVSLRELGIRVAGGHSPKNIESPDLALVTPGLYEADEEVNAAKIKGIPVLSWQSFIGRYLDRRPGKGFMVAGTFGKGSTAAVLAHMLAAAYLDPLALLGVEDIAWSSNVRLGFGDAWIMEADEFNRHFHNFHPSYAALTSFEHEHVSTYPTFEEYSESFQRFFSSLRDPKIVVAKKTKSIDDARGTVIPVDAVSYALDDPADVAGKVIETNSKGSRFLLHAPKYNVVDVELSIGVPGRIHIENAVGAAALALAAGIGMSAVNAGLSTFKGLRRRFEIVMHGSHTTIFDYAHTPTRMSAVIQETRQLFPKHRVIVLFEPHLFSRTIQYRNEFRQVLAQADRAYVADIYPSREAHGSFENKISSKDIVGTDDHIAYAGSLIDAIAAVAKVRTELDVVLVLGAGPIQARAQTLVA